MMSDVDYQITATPARPIQVFGLDPFSKRARYVYRWSKLRKKNPQYLVPCAEPVFTVPCSFSAVAVCPYCWRRT